jgi:hypothetical protein
MGDAVYCFERRLKDETLMTLINFSDGVQSRRHDSFHGDILISTHEKVGTELHGDVHLRPNEAIVFKVS